VPTRWWPRLVENGGCLGAAAGGRAKAAAWVAAARTRARACRSTLVVGLRRASPRHHGVVDGPRVNAEKQHALDATSCTRSRASSSGAYDAMVTVSQSFFSSAFNLSFLGFPYLLVNYARSCSCLSSLISLYLQILRVNYLMKCVLILSCK
jgi:hypothetical protein